MKKLLILLLLLPSMCSAVTWPIKMHSSGKYLTDSADVPFLIVADAGWGLALLSTANIDTYIADRSGRGFNAVEIRMIDHSYCSGCPNNASGEPPFCTTAAGALEGGSCTGTHTSWIYPNEDYWDRVDYAITKAKDEGMVVLAFPAYIGYACGVSGWCPDMQAQTDGQMYAYGQWIGTRYKDYGNILWMLAGDATDSYTDILARVTNVRDGVENTDTDALFSAEPTSEEIAGIDSWDIVDINAVYTYGDGPDLTYRAYDESVKPFMFQEGYYENEIKDIFTSTLLNWNGQLLQTFLGGGLIGAVHGVCPLWSFGYYTDSCVSNSSPYNTWQNSMAGTGSVTSANIGKLMKSRAWNTLQPDYTDTIVTAGKGSRNTYATYHSTAKTSDSETVMVWCPDTNQITVDMTEISGTTARAWWWDPDDNSATNPGDYATTGTRNFTPSSARLVLVLDDLSSSLAAPGTTEYYPDTHNVTCSGTITTALQAAITDATGGTSSYSTGDTVLVSAGTCTIGDITVNKNITLQGAGSSSTYMTGGTISSTNYNPRITGFNFDGVTITIDETSLSTVTGFRVDNNVFTNYGNADKSVYVRGGYAGSLASHPTGLIDNNTFNSGIILIHGDLDTGASNGDKLWYLSDGFGAITNVVYAEDNVFTNASHLTDCFDSNYGGRFVFRHNTVTNRTMEFHGIQSDENRGVSLWEIYENDFTSTAGWGVWARSGGGVIFNNTFSGYSAGIMIDNQTSCRYGAYTISPSCLVGCSGSNPRDGNRTGTNGYPCRDQIGRGRDTVLGHTGDTQILSPLYSWNNKLGVNEVTIPDDHCDGMVAWAIAAGCTVIDYTDTHLEEGRDYYTGRTSFDGTAGVGWGLFSAMPATCTPTPNADDVGEGGVAYWATDTNTLYRCSATNTWTVHYQPAAYPHSLQGEVPPTITGVSIQGVTIQ